MYIHIKLFSKLYLPPLHKKTPSEIVELSKLKLKYQLQQLVTIYYAQIQILNIIL